MVSVLTRIFGLQHIETAEDIVQDTFLKAVHDWSFNRIPPNPQAWLYKVAKNKTIDYIRHQKHVRDYETELNILLKSEWTLSASVNNLFLENEIKDSLLRMIFTSCHPSLPVESGIALTLKTLCGFNIKEISKALLTTEANINKRLFRAKQKIKEENLKFEIPEGRDLAARLETVYKVIYLLFNEGYNAADAETLVRKDLCQEAIRLCVLLSEHPIGKMPDTYALIALMCFQAARLDARIDTSGRIVLLAEQDRILWDHDLILKGYEYLSMASYGEEISEYHLEAAIAAHYCKAPAFHDTDWAAILDLYNMLLKMKPSPVTLLNRSIVIAQLSGAEQALKEIEGLIELDSYYLYHTVIAEFYSDTGKYTNARSHLLKALELTKSNAEIKLINKRIEKIKDD